MILCGSNYKEGDCVRSLFVKNKNLLPGFQLSENKQRIRSSWYNKNVIIYHSSEYNYLNPNFIKLSAQYFGDWWRKKYFKCLENR